MPPAVRRSPHDFPDVAAVAGWYNAASGRANPAGELQSNDPRGSRFATGDEEMTRPAASCLLW